jgi:hypothetical protein
MAIYENGYFKKHVDYQFGPNHTGNEILLPPKRQIKYQGGELVLYLENKILSI